MKKSVAIVLFFAFLIRLIFSTMIHPIGDYIFSDSLTYWNLSNELFIGRHDLFNIFYPPGYPLFISLVRNLFGNKHIFIWLGIIQSILGTLTIYFVLKISQLVLDKKRSFFLLFLLTIYYPLVDYTGYLMSETLATFLLSFTLHCLLVKNNYPLSVFGTLLTILVRSNLSLTLLPLLFISTKKGNLSHRFLAIIFILIVGGSINFLLSGKFSVTSLNGGLNFMQGQCLIGHSNDSTGRAFGPPVYMQRNINSTRYFPTPFTNSNYFYQEGMKCLAQNPKRTIEKIWELTYLFMNNIAWPSSQFVPFFNIMEISQHFFYIFVFSGIVLTTFVNNKIRPIRIEKTLWWVVGSCLLVAYVYYADIRYRLPYDPYFLLLALVGFSKFRVKIDRG